MTTPQCRSRHARHSHFSRLRRSPRLQAALNALVTLFTGPSAGSHKTFTADHTTGRLTVTGHGYHQGEGPFTLANTGGALPAGLSAANRYWVDVIDANTLALSQDRFDAGEGKELVAFTDNGSGTNTIFRTITEQGIFNLLKTNRAETLKASTNIDTLK